MSGSEEQGPEARRAALALALGEAVTLDGLCGSFQVLQRRRGHRHSTDDLLTAWYAALAAPPTGTRRRLLDLGTGIGSIALTMAWLDPDAEVTAVEAQAISHRLLTENVALNGVAGRVSTVHGDLREVVLEPGFDLVTGSPPYFPPGTGVVSADSQRAHARFELRGDVRDYAAAAKRLMAEGGQFVFCFPTPQRRRAEAACTDAGLTLLRSCDVIPREGTAALFSLFACRHARGGAEPVPPPEPAFVVRDARGEHTEALRAARAHLGLG